MKVDPTYFFEESILTEALHDILLLLIYLKNLLIILFRPFKSSQILYCHSLVLILISIKTMIDNTFSQKPTHHPPGPNLRAGTCPGPQQNLKFSFSLNIYSKMSQIYHFLVCQMTSRTVKSLKRVCLIQSLLTSRFDVNHASNFHL